MLWLGSVRSAVGLWGEGRGRRLQEGSWGSLRSVRSVCWSLRQGQLGPLSFRIVFLKWCTYIIYSLPHCIPYTHLRYKGLVSTEPLVYLL